MMSVGLPEEPVRTLDMSISRSALALASCAAFVACSVMTDPSSTSTTPQSLARWILVSPAAPTIPPGQTLQLVVRMLDSTGRDVVGQPQLWSTSDSAIASVASDGTVSAHAIGSAQITIASGKQRVSAFVTVSNTPPAPTWVTVNPGTAQVSVRSTLRLLSSVTDVNGHPITNTRVTWTSADPSVARVDSIGMVTGVSTGSVNILAHTASNQATAQLTVVGASTTHPPPPQTPNQPAPPAPPPPVPPTNAGSLYNGYSTVSPHWPHIRTATTDFYYSWNSSERTWAGQHYDLAMSGIGSAWKAVNPTVQHYPYILLGFTVLPAATPSTSLPATQWYDDAVQWYAAHTQYNIETAFLHRLGQPADLAHRLSPYGWSTYTWVINPGDPGLIAYQTDRIRRLAASEDGLFIDVQASGDLANFLKDSTGRSSEYTNSGNSWPPTGQYFADYAALLRTLKSAVGSKTLQPNTGMYTFDLDFADLTAAGATHMEKANNPLFSGLPSTWSWIDKLLGASVVVNFVDALDYSDMRAVATRFGGTADSAYHRIKMVELASYYMVVPHSPDKLQLQLVNEWSRPFSTVWITAQEANIGHPTATRERLSQGVVSTDLSGQQVTVYQRDFDRALVIVRPQTGWGTQRYDDASAVSIPLPTGETWIPLHADGTLGAPVNTIKLRNAEAAILIKQRTI
jgi:Bacterial Ig-like domain (group 2)